MKASAREIENLLLRMQNDDEEAFHLLYLMLKTAVYSYSLSLLQNKDDALDNVQDVFITIYTKINNYDTREKPLSWIFTITKNAAISKMRKRKVTSDIDEEIVSSSDKKDSHLLLHSLMEKLSREERNVVLLHTLWGFKHWEIAKLLDSNLSTILSKYHRAIKKLKEMGVEK